MRVLIVEDNRRLAESIRDILKHWYDCDICGDGNTGYFLLTDGGYDAAVLDLMLPGMDGITLLKKARKSGCSVPVLILTAKSEIDDRVLGLESGADYYLTKPFDSRELTACVRALLRRQGSQVDEMGFGNTILDLSTAVLSCAGKEIRLSAKEFDILRLLFQSGAGNLSKETILARVWGYDSDAVENHVEVYMGFLRKKLLSIGSNVRIEAIRRMGYHLEVAEHDS